MLTDLNMNMKSDFQFLSSPGFCGRCLPTAELGKDCSQKNNLLTEAAVKNRILCQALPPAPDVTLACHSAFFGGRHRVFILIACAQLQSDLQKCWVLSLLKEKLYFESGDYVVWIFKWMYFLSTVEKKGLSFHNNHLLLDAAPCSCWKLILNADPKHKWYCQWSRSAYLWTS